jgi:DNA-binding LacI/PurR family transcriptional regulator
MIKKHPPTIYDVARTAGVSISTVSRVLNAPELVNESTRVTILAAIDSLGFVPKAEARARALRSSGRVGVITPFFTSPSFVQRLRGVASVLTESNYELVIFTVDTYERLQHYLETIPLTHNLDGLVLISVRIDNGIAQRMSLHRLETVLIEYPITDINSIEIDNELGGRMAAEYLLERGYRKFAFVGETNFPKYGINPINSRLSGFRDVLHQAEIEFNDELVWETPFHVDATRYLALEKLKEAELPMAIFSATDLQAIGVLKAARQLGLKVPDDVAILGFDDLDIAEYMGLSTVRQPLDESGRVAAELLFSRLLDPNRPIQHIRLPLTLVSRETT